jgi:hypothetical protein
MYAVDFPLTFRLDSTRRPAGRGWLTARAKNDPERIERRAGLSVCRALTRTDERMCEVRRIFSIGIFIRSVERCFRDRADLLGKHGGPCMWCVARFGLVRRAVQCTAT